MNTTIMGDRSIAVEWQLYKGPSIKYVSKIFRKTNISSPLINTRTCAFRGLEMLVFRKILRTYLLDDA